MEEIRTRIENLLQQISSYRKETIEKIKVLGKQIYMKQQENDELQKKIDKLESYQDKVPEEKADLVKERILELEIQKSELQRELRNLAANRYKASTPVLAGELKSEAIEFYQARENIIAELNETEKQLVSKLLGATDDKKEEIKEEIEEEIKECRRLRNEMEKLDVCELVQIDLTDRNVLRNETVIKDVKEQILGEEEETGIEREDLKHRLKLGVPSYQQQLIASAFIQKSSTEKKVN